MYGHTIRMRKPAYHPELEDPTKQIDLRVLEEHIRRSQRTMIIESVVEPDLERTTLQFRAQPVYPVKRRPFPAAPLAIVMMLLAGAAMWVTMI